MVNKFIVNVMHVCIIMEVAKNVIVFIVDKPIINVNAKNRIGKLTFKLVKFSQVIRC